MTTKKLLIEELMENPTEDMIRVGKIAMREYLRRQNTTKLEAMLNGNVQDN